MAVACQAHLSMEFSRQEYWSGLPFPTPGDPPNPGIDPMSLCLLHWQGDRWILHHYRHLGSLGSTYKKLKNRQN